MAERKKKDAEVEIVEEVETGVIEDGDTPEDADLEEQPVEEFNEHIKALVKNFVQQEIGELEGRIRDLEVLTQSLLGAVGVPNDDAAAKPLAESSGIPEYRPASRDNDGVPWY